MRGAIILLPMLAALSAAGCARQQQAQYIIDPQTGQPVPVVQRYDQRGAQTYAQQPYAQPSYARQASAPQPRAQQTYSQQSCAQQAYAQQPRAQQAYAQQPRARQAYGQPQYTQASSRGLFSSPQAAQQSYRPQYAQPYPQQQRPQPQNSRSRNRGLFSGGGVGAAGRHRARSAPPRSYVLQYHPPAAATGGPYAAAPYGYAYAPAGDQTGYRLDAGDKLRIVVFGQQGISGTYLVDAGGNVSLPLVGTVSARGATTEALTRRIRARLKQGYVRDPHVTVTIEGYRPFFILGEVTTPGQYPYVPNMTVENAVAVAGGFSPRAKKGTVELTRNAGGQRYTSDVPLNYTLRPGDTVVVKERWF
jgi:polysaccharide export outer membrane protein